MSRKLEHTVPIRLDKDRHTFLMKNGGAKYMRHLIKADMDKDRITNEDIIEAIKALEESIKSQEE